ncbi:uncharacterized serine-rich protein C215.13-like [Hyalella azteca]|uniref:Uncharacterized serine-rich protein C215.13-like n=1 Tax=Hyalella azteca TaxID=294128 RepID=A0A8B7NT01_HYAAZ|nr:uncharacterized serine-rich protein C215.13-like [Hyalella azteca]
MSSSVGSDSSTSSSISTISSTSSPVSTISSTIRSSSSSVSTDSSTSITRGPGSSIRCACSTKECRQQHRISCSTQGSCYVQQLQHHSGLQQTRGCIDGFSVSTDSSTSITRGPGSSIRCACSTKECRQQHRISCSTQGSCYVQQLQHHSGLQQTRGCIEGLPSQSLLCSLPAPVNLLTKVHQWPRLACCSSDLCNAPLLLDLSTDQILAARGTSATKMSSPGSEETGTGISEFSDPENGRKSIDRGNILRMNSEITSSVASDGATMVEQGWNKTSHRGATLLHTLLTVLTVLCSLVLCAVALLAHAIRKNSTKYYSNSNLKYVIV